MGKIKAIGLIRVSTARQADQDHFGIPAQRAAIGKLAKQYDLEVVETVEYSDVSGADVLLAPAMQRVLQLIARPEIRAVAAKEFSRLMRPTDFSDWILLQKFVEAGITLYLPTGPNELSSSHGRFFATIQGAMAGLELSTIKARLEDGREESRKLGYCAAGGRTVPTGVTWDVRTKKWGYDSVYAPKIRKAFEMLAAGETNFKFIINTLNLRLRPTKGAAKLATATSLRRLLENRLFIGERVWDKKVDLSVPKEKLLYLGKDGKLHKRKPPLVAREKVIVRQVIEQPLVSRELFERVQVILRAKSDRVRQMHALHAHREKFAYRGLLLCGECGQPMYTVFSRANSRYRCRDGFTHRGGTRQCAAPSLRKDQLEAELDRFFSKTFSRSQFFAEILRHSSSNGRGATAKHREQLQAQQKALLEKRERIIEFALDGVYSKADRDRRLVAVDEDIELNRKELAELVETPMPTFAEWQRLLRPFREGFTGLPIEEKRKLIESRFQEIKVRDYRVVSLYLLTGEPVPVDSNAMPSIDPDPACCYSCGCQLRKSERSSQPRNYCAKCSDEMAVGTDRLERIPPAVLGLESGRVAGSSDTSLGL